jgi:hypothetical protein
MSNQHNRPLTETERALAQSMLERGTAEAKPYIAQLDAAEVTPWKCTCGCASLHFQIRGHDEPPSGGGLHILGDFLMGEGEHLSGAFIYSKHGLLRGIEVYGLASDAPRAMPKPEDLRAIEWKEHNSPFPHRKA